MPHRTIAVKGQDLHTLLFNFLDEVLFLFHTEAFVTTSVTVTELDTEQWSLEASACVYPFFYPCFCSPKDNTSLVVVCCCVSVLHMLSADTYTPRRGALFDPAVHECGTEVKAITYSAMKVLQAAERTDAYVIVDI